MCSKNTSVLTQLSGNDRKLIKEKDVATTLHDNIVDEDITEIEPYYTQDAWALLKQKGESIKSAIITVTDNYFINCALKLTEKNKSGSVQHARQSQLH